MEIKCGKTTFKKDVHSIFSNHLFLEEPFIPVSIQSKLVMKVKKLVNLYIRVPNKKGRTRIGLREYSFVEVFLDLLRKAINYNGLFPLRNQ